jgi:hypothetical protein
MTGPNKPHSTTPEVIEGARAKARNLETQLGELRAEMRDERHRRRLVRANALALVFAFLLTAGEVVVLALGILERREDVTAVLFACSCLFALLASIAALRRLGRLPNEGVLVSRCCIVGLACAAVLALVGAFVASWPS